MRSGRQTIGQSHPSDSLKCLLGHQFDSDLNAHSVLAQGLEGVLEVGPVLPVECLSDNPLEHLTPCHWTGRLTWRR